MLTCVRLFSDQERTGMFSAMHSGVVGDTIWGGKPCIQWYVSLVILHSTVPSCFRFFRPFVHAGDDILFTLYERRCYGIGVLSKPFLQRYLTLRSWLVTLAFFEVGMLTLSFSRRLDQNGDHPHARHVVGCIQFPCTTSSLQIEYM